MNKFLLKILVLLPLLFGTAKLGAQVTIGADDTPQSFSVLELVAQYKTGTYGGLRLPQMTTTERDGLGDLTSVSEAYGLMIYNTTAGCVEYWNNIKWVSLCTGRADITLTGNCDPENLFFAPDGTNICTLLPSENPPCSEAYQVYLTAGSTYTTLQVDELTSEFSIMFSPNNSSYNRIAVVRVVNNCSGEYQDFVFTQEGADCPTGGIGGFNVFTSSTTLCGNNGAVIAWVNNPDPGMDYIWAYGGQIVHTGNYLQITRTGTYTVYAGLLGCETTPSQSIDIVPSGSGSSSGAPTITVTNDGILCSGGTVVLTASNIAIGNTVKWFYNDSLCTACTANPLTVSGATAAGDWFAVQEDGGCGSKMSNIITLYDQTTTSIALAQPIATVNGEPLTGNPTVCKDGTLELAVINNSPPYPAGTIYEWFDGTTSIYKGTEPIIYSVAQNKETMILSVQVSNDSDGCPNTVVSDLIIVTAYAPAATTINNGVATAAICGSVPATLSALNNMGDEYEWFKDGVKITTPDANNPVIDGPIYKATATGNYAVRYTDFQDCWSLLSPPISVVQSAAISLNWQTAPSATVIVGSSESYTVLASPSANSYSWSSSPSGLATITQIPPGNSATVDYLVIDNPGVTITVTATNACGTTPLSTTIKIEDDCAPFNSIGIVPSTTVNINLDHNGNPISGSSTVTFTATAFPNAAADGYEWYVDATKQPVISNQFIFIPSTASSGTYSVYAKATSVCDTVTSNSVTVIVTKALPPQFTFISISPNDGTRVNYTPATAVTVTANTDDFWNIQATASGVAMTTLNASQSTRLPLSNQTLSVSLPAITSAWGGIRTVTVTTRSGTPTAGSGTVENTSTIYQVGYHVTSMTHPASIIGQAVSVSLTVTGYFPTNTQIRAVEGSTVVGGPVAMPATGSYTADATTAAFNINISANPNPSARTIQFQVNAGGTWTNIGSTMTQNVFQMILSTGRYVALNDATSGIYPNGTTTMQWPVAIGISTAYNAAVFSTDPLIALTYTPTQQTGCGGYWEGSTTHPTTGVGKWRSPTHDEYGEMSGVPNRVDAWYWYAWDGQPGYNDGGKSAHTRLYMTASGGWWAKTSLRPIRCVRKP